MSGIMYVVQHLLQNAVMKDHLLKLVTEKGLDSQEYRCSGCHTNIGLSKLGSKDPGTFYN